MDGEKCAEENPGICAPIFLKISYFLRFPGDHMWPGWENPEPPLFAKNYGAWAPNVGTGPKMQKYTNHCGHNSTAINKFDILSTGYMVQQTWMSKC